MQKNYKWDLPLLNMLYHNPFFSHIAFKGVSVLMGYLTFKNTSVERVASIFWLGNFILVISGFLLKYWIASSPPGFYEVGILIYLCWWETFQYLPPLLPPLQRRGQGFLKETAFYLEHAKLKIYWEMQCNSGSQNSRDLFKEYLLMQLIFHAPHKWRNIFQRIYRPTI